MKIISTVFLCVITFILTGCATSGIDYTPPGEHKVTNSLAVKNPFNKVWKTLLHSLSGEFFIINNIEKDSGIINVSFSTDSPENYVDCGETTRTFSNARGKRVYEYKTAGSSQYTVFMDPYLVDVSRNTALSGRANILVTEKGRSMTNVIVNAKYVLDIKTKGYLQSGKFIGGDTNSVTFTSKKPSKEILDKNGIICRSNGLLEQQILDFVRQ